MKNFVSLILGSALSLSVAGIAYADIKVGLVTSLSGPGASIGIPYSKGMKAAIAHQNEVGGEKITLIELDDASDPSAASRNTRKLIVEDKVDVLMGTSGVPGSLAMLAVAKELKTPMIGLTPLPQEEPIEGGPWVISVPQTPQLMVDAAVQHMAEQGYKRVAYIGFSDSWGDLVYDSLMASAEEAGIEIVANERYARPDTSVTAQVLKIIATNPDAVMNGGSGTPGALPFLALQERGYQGPIYGSHALINKDFVRVGGSAAEGVIAATGPVVVAEQLPEDAPTKAMAMEFRAAYEEANGATTTDGFSPYSFDGWLLMLDAAEKSLETAEPGTPEFREAMRSNLVNATEVVGAHGVYNFTPESRNGLDERARVLVELVDGAWTVLKQ